MRLAIMSALSSAGASRLAYSRALAGSLVASATASISTSALLIICRTETRCDSVKINSYALGEKQRGAREGAGSRPYGVASVYGEPYDFGDALHRVAAAVAAH